MVDLPAQAAGLLLPPLDISVCLNHPKIAENYCLTFALMLKLSITMLIFFLVTSRHMILLNDIGFE